MTIFLLLIYTFIPFVLFSYCKRDNQSFTKIFTTSLLLYVLFETSLILILIATKSVNFVPAIIIHTIFYIIISVKYKYELFNIKKIKIDRKKLLITISAIVITFLSLSTPHYRYTGEIALPNGEVKQVENVAYPYPYISDAWYAISLVKGVIFKQELPNKIFIHKWQLPFTNVQMPFHLFMAGIVNNTFAHPVNDYVLLGIFFNTLLAFIAFLLALNLSRSYYAGLTIMLLVPLITHGANMFTIWDFIPINMGLILLLTFYCKIDETGRAKFLAALLTIVFYPPLIVFVAPAFIKKDNINRKSIGWVIVAIGLIFLMLHTIISSGFDFTKTINYLIGRLYFDSYTGSYIAQFHPWYTLPVFLIPILLLGIKTKPKMQIVIPLFIALIFWIYCSFSETRIIWEHERVTFIGSLFLTIFSVFGIKIIMDKNRYFKFIFVAIIIVYSYNLTKINNWRPLLAIDKYNSSKVLTPEPPANFYLPPDYYITFKNIENKVILSTPWVSTAVSTATANYAALTKGGTIKLGSNSVIPRFIRGNCDEKYRLIKKYHVDYVFLPHNFSCSFLKKKSTSVTKFNLYQVLY